MCVALRGGVVGFPWGGRAEGAFLFLVRDLVRVSVWGVLVSCWCFGGGLAGVCCLGAALRVAFVGFGRYWAGCVGVARMRVLRVVGGFGGVIVVEVLGGLF